MQGSPLEVRWLKRALVNLEAEAEYIPRDSPAAHRMVAAIDRSVQYLVRDPSLGRPGRVGAHGNW